jgi:hypothetical protein
MLATQCEAPYQVTVTFIAEAPLISQIDDVLFRCIDKTLVGVDGVVIRDALYLDLLTKLSVTREEISRTSTAWWRSWRAG